MKIATIRESVIKLKITGPYLDPYYNRQLSMQFVTKNEIYFMPT